VSHDPAFVRLLLAAMQVAVTPNGSVFISKGLMRMQLREAVGDLAAGAPAKWLPCHIAMLNAARACSADPAAGIAMAVVQASVEAQWPALASARLGPAVTAWQTRADIGDRDIEVAA
jgi:hypothetical protein